MFRRVKKLLFGYKPKHRGAPAPRSRFGYRGHMEVRPYEYFPDTYQEAARGSAGSPWLPRHQTVTVEPGEYADSTPTQIIPVVPPEPRPFIQGRDLLTGQRRAFGNPYMALLGGIRQSVPVMYTLQFSDAR